MPFQTVSQSQSVLPYLWLLLLSLSVWGPAEAEQQQQQQQQQQHHHQTCSRQLSKQALSVVEKVLLPVYQKRSLEMPQTCPYQPKGTHYYDNEKRTFSHSPGNWQCGYCGKSFYRESSLWRHYERKHPETITNSSSCLADLCPVLRCEVLSSSPLPESLDYWQQALCKEVRMLPLMERCMNSLQSCIPAVSASDRESVKDELIESMCSYLTCDSYYIAHKAFLPRAYASQLWKVVLLIIVFYAYYIFVCMHMCDSLGVPRDSRSYFSNKRR